jgi:hypothetical protein
VEAGALTPSAATSPASIVECAPMTSATRGDAEALLTGLRSDAHYLALAVYGDGG